MESERNDKQLMSAYRAGDESAAAELFRRYYDRIVRLARQKMKGGLGEIEGSSDLAQSILRNVFERGREGAIDIRSDDGLWPLLVRATINKVRDKARFWNRQRRDASKQQELDEPRDAIEQEPSPSDLAVLNELLDLFLSQFSERRRKILLLLLEGHGVGETAVLAETTERTVYNTRREAALVIDRIMARD